MMKNVALLSVILTAATALRLKHADFDQSTSQNLGDMTLYRKYHNHYVNEPIRTTLKDISDDEASSNDMDEEKLTAFNVTIMVYKNDEEFLSRSIKRQHAWDTEEVQQICDKWIQAGAKGNLLDIGANLGTYSLPLAKCMKQTGNGRGTVVAIEAIPNTAKKLRASMRKNNFDNIHLYEYAIGLPLEADSVTFDQPVANMGNAHMNGLTVPSAEAAKGSTSQIVIPFTTLDAITQQDGDVMANVFAAKVDIEGSELMAFQGGEKFFISGPCIIFMETRYNSKALHKFLNKKDYQVAKEDTQGNTWFHQKDMEQCLARLH